MDQKLCLSLITFERLYLRRLCPIFNIQPLSYLQGTMISHFRNHHNSIKPQSTTSIFGLPNNILLIKEMKELTTIIQQQVFRPFGLV